MHVVFRLDIDCSSPAARVAWLLRPVTYCALTMADAGDRQAAAAFHLSAVVLHMSLHEERSHLSKLACWHLHETMNIMPRTEVMDGVCIMRNWKYSLSSWAEKLLSNLQVFHGMLITFLEIWPCIMGIFIICLDFPQIVSFNTATCTLSHFENLHIIACCGYCMYIYIYIYIYIMLRKSH